MKTRTEITLDHASARRMPQRAAKIRGSMDAITSRPISRTTRTTGRVTRSSIAQINASSGNTESDDDLIKNYSSGAQSTSSATHRKLRKRAVAPESPGSPTLSHRAKRPRKRPGFYGEETESDDSGKETFLSSDSDHQYSTSPVPPSKTRSSPQRQLSGNKKPAAPYTDDAAPETATETPIIPAWTNLPYFILVQVFRHAFASMEDRPGVQWLLQASRLCRAFAEPALTALYECPPLLNRQMAHNFVELLAKDPSETLFNYRQKVEKLRIDVEEIASKMFRGQQLDHRILISSLPRLKTVDFFHRKDMPPFRALGVSLRWHYPSNLFEALGVRIDSSAAGSGAVSFTNQNCAVKLGGWRWNRRLMGGNLDLQKIKCLHAMPAFSRLKRISFVNYQVPSIDLRRIDDADAIATDQDYIRSFAESIAALPELEYLAIESSSVVNAELLPLLPKTLQSLTLINCWDVRADEFADFLLSHGRRLRQLVLHHNQSLSLAFLTVLGASCPDLLTLSMDCKYFKHLDSYDDSEPGYNSILTVDQVPVWPKEIETIQLLNIRKWDMDAAQVFFQSLVDNAANLPNLRHLHLKLMLDIPFRSRIEFRDIWEPKLKKVFLRKWEDPRPVHSLWPRTKDVAGSGEMSARKKAKTRRAQESLSPRRSNRIATLTSQSDPLSHRSRVSKSRRYKGTRPSYAELDTDDDPESGFESDELSESSAIADNSQSSDSKPRGAVHGMCEIVDVQLDNQKPTERVLSMNDFLDSESDDPTDEDWNGDDDFDDDYAW